MEMKVGDKVEWTDIYQFPNRIKMTQKYGKVVGINGVRVTVVMRNGHRTMKHIDDLHVCGSGDNQLTQLLNKMAGGSDV